LLPTEKRGEFPPRGSGEPRSRVDRGKTCSGVVASLAFLIKKFNLENSKTD